jgi:hypothetical protein
MLRRKNVTPVPDGWVLVPVMPTPAMIAAGRAMAEECKDAGIDMDSRTDTAHSYEYLTYDAPARIFEAMLKAAPSPDASDTPPPSQACQAP